MNKRICILFLSLFCLSSNSQTTNSFLNRGVISTSLGKSGIVGNYYSESVLCNPANLYAVDTLDLDFTGIQHQSDFLAGLYCNFNKSTTIGCSFYSKTYHNSSDSLDVYRNIISLSKLIFIKDTKTPLVSLGINVMSLGIQKDMFQQESVDFGANILFRYFTLGTVASSGSTLYLNDSLRFQLPFSAGIGSEILLDSIFKSQFWRFRIDYMYSDGVTSPHPLSNSSNLFIGLNRGFLFPSIYKGNLKLNFINIILGVVDGFLPYCYGVSLNNINNRSNSFYPEYHLGWSNITIFDAPLHLEPNFRFNLSYSFSKNNHEMAFGLAFGYR